MQREHKYFVYIITNKHNTVLYTGVTNSMVRRGYEHKAKFNQNSFTKKYNVDKLVHYEEYSNIMDAIVREKQIKGESRQDKIDLINQHNTGWKDLYLEDEIFR